MSASKDSKQKRVLVFATKLGYQTRSFNSAAEKLGIELAFVTDRCQRLDDPWGDRAIAVHFESPETASATVINGQNGASIDGIVALGDRPGPTAAFVARSLGMTYNHPSSVEACRSKLRTRQVFHSAGLPAPWFQSMKIDPLPEPALASITYPCVLKPISLSARQAVVR